MLLWLKLDSCCYTVTKSFTTVKALIVKALELLATLKALASAVKSASALKTKLKELLFVHVHIRVHVHVHVYST